MQHACIAGQSRAVARCRQRLPYAARQAAAVSVGSAVLTLFAAIASQGLMIIARAVRVGRCSCECGRCVTIWYEAFGTGPRERTLVVETLLARSDTWRERPGEGAKRAYRIHGAGRMWQATSTWQLGATQSNSERACAQSTESRHRSAGQELLGDACSKYTAQYPASMFLSCADSPRGDSVALAPFLQRRPLFGAHSNT